MDGAASSRRIVIAGNGMAGARLADELRRSGGDRLEVVVVGAEPLPAYNRILLSAVLAGDKSVQDIYLPAAVGEGAILGDAVAAIDRWRRCVATASGRTVSYDALVLATGSHPIVPAIAGTDLPGVVSFRDIQDVTAMIAAASGDRRAVVIGGGLLGLEAAEGLRRRCMPVTVVHLTASLMERQLDATAGRLLQESLERRGIAFELNAETIEITGADRVTGIRLKSGAELPADLVVLAIGIKPNVDLARAAGLTCNRGVVVDDAMRTSDPAIYAVGECAEHRGRSYGLVAPLWDQVAVCAARLAGDAEAAYAGSTVATNLKVTGVDVYSAGELTAEGGDEIVLRDPARGVYRKLVLRGGRLAGAVLYGDASDGAWYTELVRAARPVGELRANLIFGRAFAEPATPTGS
jgi:nitrite reductase (NADH) large subunit